MRCINLRSDTVTLPTHEMLEAITNAPLGDDVYGDDPTVNKLEEQAAKIIGKEKALLVTSGTQANLVSALAHTKRGDEVILEATSHMYLYEVGGISAVGGLLPKPVTGHLGILDPRDVENAIREQNIHYPESKLVVIENTHNMAGGTCWNPTQIQKIHEIAVKYGLKVHMDGARVFNAAISLNVDVKELTKHVDSVMFCLSKGLSAPIGSIVAGKKEFIATARKNRKMLGGGMRQAGIIAAPGIIALEKMIGRLKEDHENATILANGLAQIRGIIINLETVQTNIVRYDIANSELNSTRFISELEKYGIKAGGSGTGMRMVTHRMINRKDINYTLQIIRKIVERE